MISATKGWGWGWFGVIEHLSGVAFHCGARGAAVTSERGNIAHLHPPPPPPLENKGVREQAYCYLSARGCNNGRCVRFRRL